jgi:hypothetical protein
MNKIEIRFNAENEADQPFISTNGVWGGITPHGVINVGFYQEYKQAPDKIVVTLADDGETKSEERAGAESVVRRFVFRTQMNAKFARSVAKFLTEKADELERSTSQKVKH